MDEMEEIENLEELEKEEVNRKYYEILKKFAKSYDELKRIKQYSLCVMCINLGILTTHII